MEAEGVNNLLVVDSEGHIQGYVTHQLLRGRDGRVDEVVHPISTTVEPGTTLKDAFSEMLAYSIGYVCVVDKDLRLLGLVTVDAVHHSVGETYTEKGGVKPGAKAS
jgi:Mg/Co/Ni transporter MgtE